MGSHTQKRRRVTLKTCERQREGNREWGKVTAREGVEVEGTIAVPSGLNSGAQPVDPPIR